MTDDAGTPAGRASLLTQMFSVATEHQPEPYRGALRKLCAKIAAAQFEAGRACESAVIAERELDLQQKEFELRARERGLLR